MTPRHWLAIIALLIVSSIITRSLGAHGQSRRALLPRSAGGTMAVGALIFLTLVAITAPYVTAYAPFEQLDIIALSNQAPSLRHPLGTDVLSRDVWTRVAYGARVSLGVGCLAMLVALVIGGAVGLLAGTRGGVVDGALMRLVDVGLAVPQLFVVMVAVGLWGQFTVAGLVVLIGCTGWFATSRLVRAEVLALRNGPMVLGAEAIGASTTRIIVRHLLPNVAATLLITAALGVGTAMLLEAALSFLGVGVRPPTPSWGNMIADGRDHLSIAPWTSVAPGLAIALAVVSLNAAADNFRDALDPRGPVGRS